MAGHSNHDIKVYDGNFIKACYILQFVLKMPSIFGNTKLSPFSSALQHRCNGHIGTREFDCHVHVITITVFEWREWLIFNPEATAYQIFNYDNILACYLSLEVPTSDSDTKHSWHLKINLTLEKPEK